MKEFKILFLCIGNSIRSQMAEGLAKKHFGPIAHVQSAGSSPSFVHPLAIEVMKEVGIDISSQRSKSITEFDLNDQNFIITLCAEEYCPIVNSTVQKFHWPFQDPYSMKSKTADPLGPFRQVRDEIQKKIKEWKPV